MLGIMEILLHRSARCLDAVNEFGLKPHHALLSDDRNARQFAWFPRLVMRCVCFEAMSVLAAHGPRCDNHRSAIEAKWTRKCLVVRFNRERLSSSLLREFRALLPKRDGSESAA